jgi:hypothetical protein
MWLPVREPPLMPIVNQPDTPRIKQSKNIKKNAKIKNLPLKPLKKPVPSYPQTGSKKKQLPKKIKKQKKTAKIKKTSHFPKQFSIFSFMKILLSILAVFVSFVASEPVPKAEPKPIPKDTNLQTESQKKEIKELKRKLESCRWFCNADTLKVYSLNADYADFCSNVVKVKDQVCTPPPNESALDKSNRLKRKAELAREYSDHLEKRSRKR